jgi:hypothetical protein
MAQKKEVDAQKKEIDSEETEPDAQKKEIQGTEETDGDSNPSENP